MFAEARRRFPVSFLLSAVFALGIFNGEKTAGAEGTGVRTWTEAGSQRTIEAEFVELTNGKVCLRRTDGKIFELDPSQLSAADRDYVQAVAGSRSDEAGAPRSEHGPQEATKIAGDDHTQTVIAEGVGANPEDALREAFRQAVRQVVGTFVDAETLVKNDELVSDKILTYSNGYITAYKKLRETARNGLVRVTIQAAVKREPLAAKLSEVNVTVAPLSGSKLFAQAVSQTAAERDALALLRSALVGFPQNIIEATSEGEPKIEERSEENVTISYQVKVAVNIDKYTPFQQRLTQVLEQIAKYKGESTLMKKPTGAISPGGSWPTGAKFETLGEFAGRLWPSHKRAWETPLDKKSDFVFVINTSRTRTHDRTTWKWYCVPKAAVASPDELARLARDISAHGRHDVCPDQARIQVEFLAHGGEAVIGDEILITDSVPGSSVYLLVGGTGGMFGWRGSPQLEECTWVVSPYIVGSSVYARSVSIPRRLELPLKTLAEIESVRCTVTGP